MAALTYKFTRPQVEMMIYELKQSVIGDNDSYDKRLKTIIKKLEDGYDNGRK